MRSGDAQRGNFRSNGEWFQTPGYGCIPRTEWFTRYGTTVLSNRAHVWYKGDDGLS